MDCRPKNGANIAETLARLLTINDAAQMLNISKRSVWRLLASGELVQVRLGRSVRVPMESVNALITRGGTR